MTLNELYNKSSKDKFIGLAFYMRAIRIISEHEYQELKEVYKNWDELHKKKPRGKVVCGDLNIKVVGDE